MRSGLVIPPQSIIRLGSLVNKKFLVGMFISRNFQVGPVKFGKEIEQSSRWLERTSWAVLSSDQQNRVLKLSMGFAWLLEDVAQVF